MLKVQSRYAVFMALLIGLVAVLPFFIFGNTRGHSAATNLAWHLGFVSELGAGTFYPRWLSADWEGLGGPTFYFYGPLPYYVSALFQWLPNSDATGWHPLGASFGVSALLSGLLAFLWLRGHVAQGIAAVCAVVYVVLPYHYEFDLLRRSALGESWAYVWMPLILFGADRMVARRPGALLLIVFGYLGLLTSHLPASVIFGWLPPVYILVAEPHRKIWRATQVLAGVALAFGLAAPYVIPALLTQDYASFDGWMWTGPYLYSKNFLFLSLAHVLSDPFIFRLHLVFGLIVFALTACGTLIFWESRRSAQQVPALLWFWLLVSLLVVLVVLPVSQPGWELSSVLPKVQFPWRFLMLLDLAFVWVLATTIAVIRRSSSALGLMFLAWMAFVALVNAAVGAYETRWVFVGDTSLAKHSARLGISSPEYRPRWAKSAIASFDGTGVGSGVPRVPLGVEMQGAEGQVLAVRRSGSNWSVRVHTPVSAALIVWQFYYPGWMANAADGRQLETTPSVPDGLLTVHLPEGTTGVEIRRGLLPEERWGYLMAGLAFLLLVGGYGYALLSRFRATRLGAGAAAVTAAGASVGPCGPHTPKG